MNALPSVTAMGNIHIGTIAGKLNGVMPATTPSGSRRYSQLTPRDTSSTEPASEFGKLCAKSTTSRPRNKPARASDRVLPDSIATVFARSSRWASTSWRKRWSSSTRSRSDVRAHPGAARSAPLTTRSTSEASERQIVPITRPSYGLRISRVRPDAHVRNSPATKLRQWYGLSGKSTSMRGYSSAFASW
jgi:hypothetical protein